jgi:hypothetical protein
MFPWPSDHIAVFCARFLSSECCSQVLLTKFHTHSLHNCYYQSPLVLPCLRGLAKEYRAERSAVPRECGGSGRGEARRTAGEATPGHLRAPTYPQFIIFITVYRFWSRSALAYVAITRVSCDAPLAAWDLSDEGNPCFVLVSDSVIAHHAKLCSQKS